MPPENILIENCTLNIRYGAITIGSEMTGGVRNVFVRNCTMAARTCTSGTDQDQLGPRRLRREQQRVAGQRHGLGGPLLLIQGNYNAQTCDFPPDITGITLAGGMWTAAQGSGR